MIKKLCLNCANSVKRGAALYCSSVCQQGYQKSVDLKSWKSGDLVVSSRRAKNLLIYEFGEKCSKCNWAERNPFSHTIPIEIEHLDGDCYNNKCGNVLLICPNCHSLTETYRALNAGKGRGRKFYKVVSNWAKEHKLTGIWSAVR